VAGGDGPSISGLGRYWRADGVPVEAMHAHFTSHVYHRHSHESYSFGVTEPARRRSPAGTGRHVSGAGMVMAFNPDDPHDGHAATGGGFTYRMVHIWPEFFVPGRRRRPAPVVPRAGARRSGDGPVGAPLHTALTGPASELERYERLTATARLLVRHASRVPAADALGPGSDPPPRRPDPRAHPRRRYRPRT
jgi:hypothetical protein